MIYSSSFILIEDCHVDERIESQPVLQRLAVSGRLGEPEPYDVKVLWQGATSPFAVFKCCETNPRVSQLRHALQTSGKIPLDCQASFMVHGEPLNVTQESFCGLQVFGITRPLYVFLAIDPRKTSQTLNENNQHRDTDCEHENLKNTVRQVLAKLVTLCGRHILTDVMNCMERSMQKPGLSISELEQLLHTSSRRNAQLSEWTRGEIQREIKKLSASESSGTERRIFLSYADLSMCLPKHLSPEAPNLQDSKSVHNATQDFNQLIQNLTKIHNDGLTLQVPRHELRAYASLNPIRQQSLFGQGSKVLSDLSLRGEERLASDVSSSGGYCFFIVKQVPILDILKRLDQDHVGTLKFPDLSKVLRKLHCDAGLSDSRLRTALLRFRKSGDSYDYISLVDAIVPPRSEQELAAAIENVMATIRKSLLRLSYGGSHLQSMFHQLDPSNTGYVALQDLKQAANKDLGLCLSQDQLNEIARRFDPSSCGLLPYGDFVAAVERGFDRWGDVNQLKSLILMRLHDAYFDEDLQAINTTKLFAALDCDGDGRISISDFQQALFSELKKPFKADSGSLNRLYECSLVGRTTASISDSDSKLTMQFSDLDKLIKSSPPKTVSKLQEMLREAVVARWRQGFDNLSSIFFCLTANKEERQTARARDGRVASIDHFICSESLYRGILENFGNLEIRRDEAHLLVTKSLVFPYGYQEFLDLLFPGSAPTIYEAAARIQSALKKRSLSDMVMRRCFETFDPDHSGSISKEDFINGVLSLDIGLSRLSISKLLNSGLIRQDHSLSCITYDEFIRFALQSADVHVQETTEPVKPNTVLLGIGKTCCQPHITAAGNHQASVTQNKNTSQVQAYLARPF